MGEVELSLIDLLLRYEESSTGPLSGKVDFDYLLVTIDVNGELASQLDLIAAKGKIPLTVPPEMAGLSHRNFNPIHSDNQSGRNRR